MIPDVEAVLVKFLDEHAAMVALGARVATDAPDSITRPWVIVTQLDDQALGGHRSDYWIEFMVQVDCYGETTAEANDVSRTVRAALNELPDASLDDVVVGSVEHLSAPRFIDTNMEPARWRYARTELVRMRPA